MGRLNKVLKSTINMLILPYKIEIIFMSDRLGNKFLVLEISSKMMD